MEPMRTYFKIGMVIWCRLEFEKYFSQLIHRHRIITFELNEIHEKWTIQDSCTKSFKNLTLDLKKMDFMSFLEEDVNFFLVIQVIKNIDYIIQ